MDTPPQRFAFTVAEPQRGLRLDVVLSDHLRDCSRSHAAHLIQDGVVAVNGKPRKPSYRVRAEDAVEGYIPSPHLSACKPEPIAVSILYEDDHLLVVDKPPNLVVHPSPGHSRGRRTPR